MGKHADWIFAEGDTFKLSLNSKSKELRTVVKHGDNLYTVTSDGQEFPLSKPAELELAAWYRANGTHFRRQKTVAASIWKFRAGDSFDYDGKKRFVLEDGNTVVDANGDVQATLSKDNMDQVYLNTGTNFRRDKSKKVKIFDIWVNGALVGSEHLPINIEIRK
jgi:hypothetical protein